MRCDDPQLALVEAPRLVRELYGARAESGAAPSAVQLQVLVCVGERPGDRIEDVAVRLGLDESTVSHALRRLLARGLVEERKSSVDARRRERQLTAAGKKMRTETVEKARRLIAEIQRRYD